MSGELRRLGERSQSVSPRPLGRTIAEEEVMQENDLPSDDAGVDARHSPFYEWLDHSVIRALVHRVQELTAGESPCKLAGN